MGSVYQLEAMDGGPGLEQGNGALLTTQMKDHNVVSVEIVGISPEPASPATPTTTIEILLTAWLIVLLRTREDGQVLYEWMYKRENGANIEAATTMRLSTSEVLPDLHVTVEQVASAIASSASAACTTQFPPFSAAGSLLLSTGSLSRVKTKTDQDEVGAQLTRPLYQ